MAQSTYERRTELAQERGYESLYAQTRARQEARAELGSDASQETVRNYAEFSYNFSEGDYDRATLREFFDEFIGGSDEDFYDWLAALYEEA